MHTDALLYVFLAICQFWQQIFGGDDAPKFLTPAQLFWTKAAVGTLAAGLLALKLYRSTGFADYKAKKNGSGHTNPPFLPESPKP